MTKINELNEKINQFELSLSREDGKVLLDDRKFSLHNMQRVEFGEGSLPKLIMAFCDSSYINQDDFVEYIGRLQDIFYEYKNESLDELTDDELIDVMRNKFEGECQGSVDFLEETILDQIAREIRMRGQAYFERYGKVRGLEDE